jgi:spore maturation protein CgeB
VHILNWPDLVAQRSQQAMTRKHNNELYYYAFQTWNRLADFEGRIEFSTKIKNLFFGLGSKPRAERLLDSGENQRLYEPDPHRLSIFLDRYGGELIKKNWKLGCGLWFDKDFFAEPLKTAAHPYLRKQYQPLPTLLEKWSGTHRLPEQLLICQTGALFYRDVMDALSEAKVDVFPFNVAHWQTGALKKMFEPRAGDKFFSINLIEGLPRLVDLAELDYICWEIDPATSPYQQISEQMAKNTHIYSYRKNNLPLLKTAGYTNSHYLPLAANPEMRRPLPEKEIKEKYRAKISFVGSSLKANADRLLNLVMRWVNKQRADGKKGDWSNFQQTLNRWITQFPNWREHTLQLIEDKLNQFNIPLQQIIEGEPLSLSMAIAEYRAHRKRIDVVQTIGEHFPIKVWGDDGWMGQTGSLGEYCGAARHEDELTSIYNGSQINLDIGRIYQPDIITMRVFDVMACGGVVLSEEHENIRELFQPDRDCVLFRKKEDLLGTITRLLENPDLRKKIGDNARKRILTSHTIKDRLGEMDLLPE